MWTLDRNLFRYLVGLYALALILAVACVVYEGMAPDWIEFSARFDAVVDESFGAQDETLLIVTSVLGLGALAWHFLALIGLRKFHLWARWSFWASIVVANLAVYAFGGYRPMFSSPLGSLIADISTGLFAVVLLLSYSREHGAVWFRNPLETLKETF